MVGCSASRPDTDSGGEGLTGETSIERVDELAVRKAVEETQAG
jgi:hypothetical protein